MNRKDFSRRSVLQHFQMSAAKRRCGPSFWGQPGLAAIVLLLSMPAFGWWDTQIRAQKSEPLLKEFPAAQCSGAAKVVDDKQADGGKGGKVAVVAPGGELSCEIDLKHSCYSVWVIARADEKDFQKPAEAEVELDLPSGKVKTKSPRPVVYATLKVKFPDGSEKSWYMPAIFRTDYAIVSKMYFPLSLDGKCQITVGIDKRSSIGMLVDRIEVRDVLGNCARQAVKEKPMVSKRNEDAGKKVTLTDERKVKNDELWTSLPDLNLMDMDPEWKKWHLPIGRNKEGKIFKLSKAFEESGSETAGWDAAVLLCATAEKYPCIDFYYSQLGPNGEFSKSEAPRWDDSLGKTVYGGWAGIDLRRLAEAYDKTFDFIDGNQALADYVHTRIPWVKTPRDVVELLDTNILQHGIDCLNRRIIREDLAAAYLPVIQGVSDVSRKMLENGLFNALHENMADAGGLDDQAFTSFSRGGVHYIGSTLYVGPALEEISNVLKLYREAGGDPKFDMSNQALYPHMAEAAYTKHALHTAGGFPIVIGDAMDLSRKREEHPAYPSRVLEGFGAVVLEDGQDQSNPRAKRAVATHTGIGRGHSHQDQLNLEFFAHGVRLMPDLGGRQEGKFHANPNMRTNCMHNIVWIDRKEFTNTFPGSTCSATGWTTAFSPQPGSQYMANSARATSHPDVSIYQRSTAMIDGNVSPDDADVYLFDVFRVKGGKEHIYCFHGAYSDKIETGMPLKPAQSEEAKAILKDRPEDSMQEGVASDPLEVSWPLRQKMQQLHQAEFYQADRPVSLTLSLFDHKNEPVYVGGASSKTYPVDMPYINVQRKQESEGLASIYPAVMEAHAGAKFIVGKKQLKVTPAALPGDAGAGVAIALTLANGRKDLCFSSLKPTIEHQIEDGTAATGEFGFISEDDKGLCSAHIVGGTKLSRGGISITCDRPAYEAKIESVNYDKRTLTLSETLPAKILDGQQALIGNDQNRESFQLGKVDGKNAEVVRTPRYYQSKIVSVDKDRKLVETELEPMVYGCDTQYCNGTTVSNEAQDKLWKAKLEPKERWMYLGWPNTRLSYPTELRMEDLPDTNGDGKRILRMYGSGGVNEFKIQEPKDKVVLELEVTRVDPANHTFYFKMPNSPKGDKEIDYRTGGWQYANRVLENEDGSRRWLATYPGLTFTWELLSAAVSDADFSDTDKDGKRKLLGYLFGPGDTLKINTFVHVRRVDGGYEVRANVPCTITIPGMETVRLTEKELAAGVCKPQLF
jgi:hypothetical protein